MPLRQQARNIGIFGDTRSLESDKVEGPDGR
jgi:hypothetical protein